MSLSQIATHTVETGSEVQEVILTGINSDNVHFLVGTNIQVGGSGGICDINPTTSGSSDTTANIDVAWIDLKTSGSFQKFGNVNQDVWRVTDGMGVSPTSASFIMYLYNFNSSSVHSNILMAVTSFNGSNLRGYQQGGVKEETTAHDGVRINTNQTGGGGFQNGTKFTLYKVV